MKTVSKVKPRKRAPTFNGKDRIFHCELTAIRANAKLTMRDVARYTGVAPSTICRAEAGLEIELSNALRLARFFETTVEKMWRARMNGA